MKGRKHTPEQIVRKLREGERLLGDGKELAQPVRGHEGQRRQELRQLRDENQRLKRMVADRELQIEMLKEISRGNF
ncbi:MAG TPA: hypothetical protein VNH82_00065 [Candidatus Dormibacteraeota bacterium]|nr:hypothetical protein [Candidatus Dormibacteraeota bacterium]